MSNWNPPIRLIVSDPFYPKSKFDVLFNTIYRGERTEALARALWLHPGRACGASYGGGRLRQTQGYCTVCGNRAFIARGVDYRIDGLVVAAAKEAADVGS